MVTHLENAMKPGIWIVRMFFLTPYISWNWIVFATLPWHCTKTFQIELLPVAVGSKIPV
jgi:hypothetical protein